MAFRVAVSGIKAATTALDVTGNNIANSNTTGFKVSRAEFADIFAASNLGTAGDAVGQGVQLSRVAQQFTQANIAFTDNSLDMAINGEGFFVVRDESGVGYTRAGAFGLDAQGFVVNGTGQRLQAFQAADDGSITGATGALQIDSTNIEPEPTNRIDAQVNLDAAEPVPTAAFDPDNPASFNNSTSLAIFDSLGESHLATMFFRKTGVNAWETHVRVDNDNTQLVGGQAIAFDTAGALTAASGAAMPLDFGSFDPGNGAAPIAMNIDFSGATQFGADFGVNALNQNGFETGRLTGLDVDEQGVVLARFSNGKGRNLGQVALANFSNPQGLQPLGDTLWAETNGSGTPLVGAPGTASLGLVQSGALEESNSELAEQLVNMIVAQRNFQANAQVIRTEDEVTQTVINIR